MQRTSLRYTARSIAAGVDAELGKYMALAESLASSPELLIDNLDGFEVEARRELPAGGGALTLGEQVTVSCKSSPEPCRTLANPGDVDNAVLILAINARDAMPEGGVLTRETRNVKLDANAARRIPNARPGDYVLLVVSDTGQGVRPGGAQTSDGALRHGQQKGDGTGLGLATVYGTVQQSGGFVAIYSAVAKGDRHPLVFPQSRTPAECERTRPDCHGCAPG